MKFLKAFAVCIFLCQIAHGQKTPVSKLIHIFNTKPNKIMVAAHRGGHLHVPENSLASIDEAISAGAAIVELDVRETKDGVMVILHDRTLDRTTTGKGEIKDFTYAELQKLFLLHNGTPSKYRIPTFKEALASAKDKIIVDIDFKIDGMQARERAYEIIDEMGMSEQVLFFLYDFTEMEHLFKINPQIKMMPRAYDYDQMRKVIDLKMTNVIHIDPSFENAEILKEARKKGIRLWINTLGKIDTESADNKQVYKDFLKKNMLVNVIQTDFPERLNKVTKTY